MPVSLSQDPVMPDTYMMEENISYMKVPATALPFLMCTRLGNNGQRQAL